MAEYHDDFLERVRLGEGPQRCREEFTKLSRIDKEKAASLLNGPNTAFPTLFLLLAQIKELDMVPMLRGRARTAVDIACKIMERGEESGHVGLPTGEDERPAYEWMLRSGALSEQDDAYGEIMDVAASVMINTYGDTGVLPVICDMIFSRHKAGGNIHYLVWAFFLIKSPEALRLAAQRIHAQDQREAELARKLLGLAEAEGGPAGGDYDGYIKWLEENDPFLYFTDESLQYSGKPVFAQVDLARKYMHQGSASYVWQPLEGLSEEEEKRLAEFQLQSQPVKSALSDYSHDMHKRDENQWKAWMCFSIGEQAEAAGLGKEALV